MGWTFSPLSAGRTRDDADRTGAAGGNLHRLMPLDDLFATARRLPPDLLSRIDNVIAVTGSTPPGGAYDTAGLPIPLTVGAWSPCPEPPPCR
jgi:hypothetical protein